MTLTDHDLDAEIGAAMRESVEQMREAFRQTLRAMPGYPWLPCPICHGTESCDHIAAERARAAGMSFGSETRQ